MKLYILSDKLISSPGQARTQLYTFTATFIVPAGLGLGWWNWMVWFHDPSKSKIFKFTKEQELCVSSYKISPDCGIIQNLKCPDYSGSYPSVRFIHQTIFLLIDFKIFRIERPGHSQLLARSPFSNDDTKCKISPFSYHFSSHICVWNSFVLILIQAIVPLKIDEKWWFKFVEFLPNFQKWNTPKISRRFLDSQRPK